MDADDAGEQLWRLHRTQAATAAALTPDVRLLCWTWAAAWTVVALLLLGAPTIGWPSAPAGTGAAFAVAGATTGVHTARRTGLAAEGPTIDQGARLGRAISAAMALGLVGGGWAAVQGIPTPNALGLGLGVAAAGAATAVLAGTALPPVPRRAVAGLAALAGLTWFAIPQPAAGALVLAVALAIAGAWWGGRP